jgi:hypothetical protein
MAKMNAEILAKLNLTDDQKTKIKAHQDEMETKVKDLRKSAKSGTDEEKKAAREKVKALQKENQEFLKQTLTKDQMKEFAKLRREAMKAQREKKGGKTPPTA